MVNTSRVILLSLLLPTISLLADEGVSISHLPPNVQNTIREWKGEGEVKKVRTLRVEGRTVYEVDYKERGDEKSILIGDDGFVIGDEQINRGRGNDKGKGKDQGRGKAKGRDKDRDDRDDDDLYDRETDVAPLESRPGVSAPRPVPRDTSVSSTTRDASATPASARAARSELERRQSAIAKLGSSRAAVDAGLATIEQETGVARATLESQRKALDSGLSTLLIVNELARATGKSVSQLAKERRAGRHWDLIAANHQVDMQHILQKLERLQNAMQTAAQTRRR